MSFEEIDVTIAPDQIEAFTRCRPATGLEELIWNALDAEAHNVDITFNRNELKGIQRVVVADDGHGMKRAEAKSVFEQIGGSRKKTNRKSPNESRPYHGKQGKGRYLSFSIGTQVRWIARTPTGNGEVEEITIRSKGARLKKVEISDVSTVEGKPGCTVIIDDVSTSSGSLESEGTIENMRVRFAPYLIAHPSVRIRFDGVDLSPTDLIASEKTIKVNQPADGGIPQIKGSIRIIEWKRAVKPQLYLCNGDAMPLEERDMQKRDPRFYYTVYLCSDYLRELDEEGKLSLTTLFPGADMLLRRVDQEVVKFLRDRSASDSKAFVERLKKQGVYPYKRKPKGPVERAERQVFAVCASKVHQLMPSFEESPQDSKKLTLGLMRTALESNPSSLSVIMSQVFKLSKEEQQELADLLKKTTLSAIIKTAGIIANRLAFLNGLEQMTGVKGIKDQVKERSQLHKILIDELWIFGDEYEYGADDVTLKTVLQAHLQQLKISDLKQDIDSSGLGGLNDIPDVFLWRQYNRGQEDRFENVVVELKAPMVNIGRKELEQVRRYASTISRNSLFDKSRTRWRFIALSAGIKDEIESEVNPRNAPQGQVTDTDEYEIWVKTWPEIIHEAKVRHRYLKKKLDYAIESNDEGMQYVADRYGYLWDGQAPQASDAKAEGRMKRTSPKKSSKKKAARKRSKKTS